jgi:type II secretory pathway pseudopilin PulG
MIMKRNAAGCRSGERVDQMGGRNGESGFTLLELMVSVFITIVIVGGVLMSFLSQRRTELNQENVAETQGNLRAGMELLKRDIRNAGFLLDDANSILAGNNTGLNASDQITVRSNGLGEDWIHYEVKNVIVSGVAVPTLIRSTDPAGAAPNDIAVIPYVDDLQIAYGWDADGNNQIDAGEWVDDSTGNEGNVEAIRINFLVRSAKPDPNNVQYLRPALEDHVAAGVPDGFPRRLLTTIVKIRNKGL